MRRRTTRSTGRQPATPHPIGTGPQRLSACLPRVCVGDRDRQAALLPQATVMAHGLRGHQGRESAAREYHSGAREGQGRVRLVVTTSKSPTPERMAEAAGLAVELGIECVDRRGLSVAKLRERERADGAIVVEHDRIAYHHAAGEFFYHPSMAKVRVRVISQGRPDPLVEAMGLEPGMTVLDCTLGRGADACVAAMVVGETGSVVGLEADPVVAALTSRGLREFDPEGEALTRAMRRIVVVCADCSDYLPTVPDAAFDVVYFDPFFGTVLSGAQAMEGLRAVARHGGISGETLVQAARVACRRVVHKTKRDACPPELRDWLCVRGRKSRVEYRVLVRGEESP